MPIKLLNSLYSISLRDKSHETKKKKKRKDISIDCVWFRSINTWFKPINTWYKPIVHFSCDHYLTKLGSNSTYKPISIHTRTRVKNLNFPFLCKLFAIFYYSLFIVMILISKYVYSNQCKAKLLNYNIPKNTVVGKHRNEKIYA